MASITIRNLDEGLKARLRVRAAQHGRSMEEEVRVMLREALAAPQEGSQGFGERVATPYRAKSLAELIREDFAETGGLDLDLPPREMGRDPPDFSGPEYEAYDEKMPSSRKEKRQE